MIKPPDFCQTCRWLEGDACGLRKAHEINWASGRFICPDYKRLISFCRTCKHSAHNTTICTKHGEDIDPGHSCAWYEHG